MANGSDGEVWPDKMLEEGGIAVRDMPVGSVFHVDTEAVIYRFVVIESKTPIVSITSNQDPDFFEAKELRFWGSVESGKDIFIVDNHCPGGLYKYGLLVKGHHPLVGRKIFKDKEKLMVLPKICKVISDFDVFTNI